MSASYDFSGRRVLITGGAGALGKGMVDKFLSAGATVFALDRDQDALNSLKQQFPSVNTLCVDLSDWEETRKQVETLAPIHHLVNNAAIPELGFLHDIKEENVNRIFQVGLSAPINLAQVMSNGLKKLGIQKGTIVNIGSIMDDRVFAGIGLNCCAKSALTTLTKVFACELEVYGVRANCVKPTIIKSNLYPKSPIGKHVSEFGLNWCLERQVNKRHAELEEVANVVLYLSSDSSEMINGSDILVDGGLYTS